MLNVVRMQQDEERHKKQLEAKQRVINNITRELMLFREALGLAVDELMRLQDVPAAEHDWIKDTYLKRASVQRAFRQLESTNEL